MISTINVRCRFLFILFATAAILFSSCSKENKEATLPPDGSTNLAFTISNLSDVGDGGTAPVETPPDVSPELDPQKRAAKAARTTATPGMSTLDEREAIRFTNSATDSILFHDELEDEAYDVQLSLTKEKEKRAAGSKIVTAPNTLKAGNQRSGAVKAAAMPSGNKYRVLIYDDSDNYVGTIDATSGTGFTPGFPVFQNTTYKWYAYSYNSTTQVPVPQNTADPTISTTTGISALLYDAGTLTTVAGSNKISINFEHKLASIALVLDARGMFATINSITASTATAADLRTGVLHLRTGAYVSTAPNNSPTALSNWTNQSAATGDSVKVAYLYTAGTTEIQNFGIALTNFVVNLDDGTTRSFSNKSYTFPQSFTPQLGNRYTATIRLIESAVTIAGIRWARENLYYRAADRGYRFRNRSNNIYNTTTNVAASGEYFNFGALTNATNATTAQRDVCRLARPYGTWRLPTSAEQSALADVVNTSGTPRRVFGQQPDARYAGWTFGGTNEYGTNWVIFLGLGRRNQNANTITNYAQSANTSGFFWSSSFTTGSTNARYMRVDINGTASNNFFGSAVTDDLSENMTFGMNIRCVRI